MSWFTDLFKSDLTTIELKRSQLEVGSQMIQPMATVLDTSYLSMMRYSRKNELAYACIEKKAQAACDAELIVEKKNGEGEWEALENHPLVTLLNKPNPFDDGESFRRAWVASENFADYFFCEIVRNGAGQPIQLYPLHPAYISAQYKTTPAGNILDYYSYTVDGYEVKYKPEELMIRRRHGLGSVFSSVSPLYVALGSIDADTALTEYVRAFFNNGGAPSGIINFKDRKLSQEDIHHYQQQWVQKYSRGGTNRSGVAVLDSGAVEYQAIGSGLDELDSDGITSKIESRICMAFGVPPILVGAYVGLLHVNQRASVREAQEDFWMNTMSPELKSIRNFLTWNMLPFWEGIEEIQRGDIRVNWDMSQVKALQEDVDAIHKRAQEDFKAQLITRNEARAALGYDEMEDPELGEALFKVAAPEAPAPDEEDEEAIEGEAVVEEEEPKRLMAANYYRELEKGIVTELEKKTFEWQGLTLGREPTELEKTIDLKGMARAYDDGKLLMSRVLLKMRVELIDQAAREIKLLEPGNVATLTLTISEKRRAETKSTVESLFTAGRTQVVNDLLRQRPPKKGEAIGYVYGHEFKDIRSTWEKFIARITDLIVSRVISEVSTRAINFFVARGLLDRDDEETIKALKAELEDQSTKMFEDIASQAANSAIGAGRDAEIEARENEWETVEYSAILDANTCDVCSDADGQEAKTSSELPPAPNPDCEGGARCRCFHVAVFKEDRA